MIDITINYPKDLVMKTLLIFPPQWIPMCPHYAISSLIAQLKHHGFESLTLDLNIEFFNDILNKEYLEKNIAKIQTSLTETLEYIKKEYSPNKKEEEYSLEFQQKLYKFTIYIWVFVCKSYNKSNKKAPKRGIEPRSSA